MTNREFTWLLDEEWKPKSVKQFTNKKELTNQEFDDSLAVQYGYQDEREMNKLNYDHDTENYLKYGDRTKGLI